MSGTTTETSRSRHEVGAVIYIAVFLLTLATGALLQPGSGGGVRALGVSLAVIVMVLAAYHAARLLRQGMSAGAGFLVVVVVSVATRLVFVAI